MIQEVYIYLDDSGVLHRNAREQYFVYAGYVFTSVAEKDRALITYYDLLRSVRKKPKKELKASRATAAAKGYFVRQMEQFESLSCVIDKTLVYDTIMDSVESIHRFKDYCIKIMIKAKLLDLIKRQIINPKLKTLIHLAIDNQPTNTDGRYGLGEGILSEFSAGTLNFRTGNYIMPIFHNELRVATELCDSKQNYLIQAADFQANSIFSDQNYHQLLKHKYRHHTQVALPYTAETERTVLHYSSGVNLADFCPLSTCSAVC